MLEQLRVLDFGLARQTEVFKKHFYEIFEKNNKFVLTINTIAKYQYQIWQHINSLNQRKYERKTVENNSDTYATT